MSLLGTFSDLSVKCYGPLTKKNPKRWTSQKSQYESLRPQNPTFPTLAQNNVWFFLLPSTTIYWYVLPSKENKKIFKNEILDWNWNFSKLRGGHFRPNSAKKLYFGELLNIFIKVSQFHTYGVTYSPCRAANFEPSWDPQAQFVQKLQPFPRAIFFDWKFQNNLKKFISRDVLQCWHFCILIFVSLCNLYLYLYFIRICILYFSWERNGGDHQLASQQFDKFALIFD